MPHPQECQRAERSCPPGHVKEWVCRQPPANRTVTNPKKKTTKKIVAATSTGVGRLCPGIRFRCSVGPVGPVGIHWCPVHHQRPSSLKCGGTGAVIG